MSSIKQFFCWLGWHSWNYHFIKFDGKHIHVRCKWCHYQGILGAQGNIIKENK